MFFGKYSVDKEFKEFSDYEKKLAIDSVRKHRDNILLTQEKCHHHRITIYGRNLVGEATCVDCGKTDRLYVFMNNLLCEFADILDAHTKKTNKK